MSLAVTHRAGTPAAWAAAWIVAGAQEARLGDLDLRAGLVAVVVTGDAVAARPDTPVTIATLFGLVNVGTWARPITYVPPLESVSDRRGISPRASASSTYSGSQPSAQTARTGRDGAA